MRFWSVTQFVAEEFANRAVFLRVDFDEHHELARQFDVAAVPTVIIFAGGWEVERYHALTSTRMLREGLRRANAGLADGK